jgi:RNA polymerase subunit RPABC4/transcription elongation factor Spt4
MTGQAHGRGGRTSCYNRSDFGRQTAGGGVQVSFGGVWQDLARVGVITVVAYLLVLWVAALVWTYRDIVSRTGDTFTQSIALVLVLVFNIPGLLLYLVLRPKDTLMDSYDRQLEAEALLHEIQDQAACPRCRRKIDQDFVACPYCRTALRTPCEHCARPMASTWVLCPYCGTERPQPAPERAGPAAALTTPAPRSSLAQPKRASTATYTPPAAPASAPAPVDPAPDAGA